MRQDPPELLAMITQLIGTPSVSSVTPELDQGNRAVIDLLAGWLDAAGFEVDVMPLADEPDRANLIATLGRGPGGLVLSGHTDTVPLNAGEPGYGFSGEIAEESNGMDIGPEFIMQVGSGAARTYYYGGTWR